MSKAPIRAVSVLVGDTYEVQGVAASLLAKGIDGIGVVRIILLIGLAIILDLLILG